MVRPSAFCGSGINDELDFRRLLKRQISGPFAFKYSSSAGTTSLSPFRRRMSGGDNRSGDYQPFAICRNRKGLSTVGAIIAAMMFRTAAITKTAVQLPVADINTLPSGTSSAAVPLAVYNKP
jgi:hypothetical protein